MSKFNIGDKVTLNLEPEHRLNGKTGELTVVDKGIVKVKLDEETYTEEGHLCTEIMTIENRITKAKESNNEQKITNPPTKR